MPFTQSLPEKLEVILKKKKMTAKRASKEAGLNETFVRDILKGNTKNPGIESLRKLATTLDCSLADLVSEDATSTDDDSHKSASLIEVDVRAAAGAGLEVEDDGKKIAFEWRVPADLFRGHTTAPLSALRIITIYGDSMEPDLPAGTRVVVDTSDKVPTPPGVFVVWDGLGLVAKRLEHIPFSDPPQIKLTSDNPKYSPYQLTLDEAHIQGRVMGRWRWM